MKDVLEELSRHPVKTRVSLTGTLVVARDIAHAKLQERLDNGQGLPEYMMKYPVYYAGPAKTPEVAVLTFTFYLSFALTMSGTLRYKNEKKINNALSCLISTFLYEGVHYKLTHQTNKQ